MTRAVGHGAYPVRIPLPLPSGHIGLLHLEKELTPADAERIAAVIQAMAPTSKTPDAPK